MQGYFWGGVAVTAMIAAGIAYFTRREPKGKENSSK